MSTNFIWILPAFYQTPNRQALKFDLTEFGKRILTNKVWERGFDYGYTDILKKLAPDDVIRIAITITPLPEAAWFPEKSENILKEFCGRLPEHNEVISHANLSRWARNFLIFKAEFGFTSNVPKSVSDRNEPFAMEFLETFSKLIAFAEELGALFRAATQLMFLSDYPIMPSMAKKAQGGGLIYIESNNKWLFDSSSTSAFTYPAVFIEPHLDEFKRRLKSLADLWHFPLWPIHRYLKALNAEYVEFENLLDLLFALEGLFPPMTSAEYIRVSTAMFLGKSRKEALEINKMLKRAYHIRNEIIHGAKYHTGMEIEKNEGNYGLSQEIILNVRKIVAEMICLALQKLTRTKGMKNLGFNLDDLFEKIFA